jgi:hypothetical protein
MSLDNLNSNDPSSPNAPKPAKRVLWWLLLIAVLVVVTLVLAGVIGLRHLMLEAGSYRSSHGFSVNGPAMRAYHDAQKIRPDTHLIVSGYYPPGTLFYMNVDLGKEFNPRKHVMLETRGVTLVVEKGIYQSQQTRRPIITHDGRSDPTQGYKVRLRRRR